MDKQYKICFLGYKQLTTLARKVIDELNYDDTDIYLVDCNVETLPAVVDDALGKDYEVFIAGSGNAAEFSRYFSGHLSEIFVRDIDYLVAIKKALKIGRRPAIASYRFSRNINLELLSDLSGAKLGHILYEDGAELYSKIEQSDYDVIIGASQANEYANELGRGSVLLYAGEDTIRRSIARARTLAIELSKEHRNNEIQRAIISNSPLGIIVNDEYGRITLMNQTAQNYIGIPIEMARGRILSELVPNLSPNEVLYGDLQQTEAYKVLKGMRVWCVQNKLKIKGDSIGVLTTLNIDNRSKKRLSSAPGDSSAAMKWKELVSHSPQMQEAISLGKKYSTSDLPLVLRGDWGSDKEVFADCIHTGGPRAQQPLISINLSSISKDDAGRHLLGSDDKRSPHFGLLEMANNGTVILRNITNANEAVQDCLFDVMNRKQLFRAGGYDPIPINIRFITLLNTPYEESAVRRDLLEKLSALKIDVPALRDRMEDIPELFNTSISREYERRFSINGYKRALDTLRYYSWPGSLIELNTVASRLVAQLRETTRITPNAVHRMVVTAIGEENLLSDIIRDYPGISGGNLQAGEMKKAVEQIKYILGFNNTLIAEKLNISRTTLWRAIKTQ